MRAYSGIKAISALAARWVVRRNAGLSESERAELAQWLAADLRHKAAFDHYARAWAAFEGPERADAQGAMIHRIQARVKRRRLRQVYNAIAAAACGVAILAFVILQPRHGADEPLPANPPPAKVVVIQPERRVFEDGSTVELREEAVIDVRYDDTTRCVILAGGEAHFQVAKDQMRPFVVVVGNMEVRAVGTAFTVQLDAEQVEVLVTEGYVAVKKPRERPCLPAMESADASAADADAHPMAMLAAGERIFVRTVSAAAMTDDTPAPEVETLTPAEINARLEWLVPRIEFSATPLSEAVALINRCTRLADGSATARLVLASELSHLAAEPVSGLFRADNIEAFVHLLGRNMPIESERRGDEIVLRKARR